MTTTRFSGNELASAFARTSHLGRMPNHRIVLEDINRLPLARQRIELVERKGKGHPDSLCDAIAEEVSQALCREYQAAFGRILHHNADKAMLVAGKSEPRLGGGRVVEPMQIVLGDRASSGYGDKRIDVAGVAEAAVRDRLSKQLRFVDAAQHVVLQTELKEGSPELTDILSEM